MAIIERLQSIELALETTPDHTPSIGTRAIRRILARSLRSFGIPRADPVVIATVHGARLRLRKSHALPHAVRTNPFYDTALPSFVCRLYEQSKSVVRVLDVGANIGDTAKIISAAVGPSNVQFICVEADPANIPLLRENLLGLSAFIVEALAGSTSTVERANFVRDHGTAYAVLGDGSSVQMIRLDDVIGTQQIDIIKIDTDGFELHVLRGLTQTIASVSPHLFIEVAPTHWRLVGQHEPMVAINFLKELGYTFCLIYDPAGYPMLAGPLDAPPVEQMINYASGKPGFYFDFLISKEPKIISEFYRAELNRIGTSKKLF